MSCLLPKFEGRQLTMLTPLSHYLQSNQAPSEDDIREIKALRAKPIEQIESILNSLGEDGLTSKSPLMVLILSLLLFVAYIGRNIQSLPCYTESNYERLRSSHTSHSDLSRLEISCIFNPSIMVQVLYPCLAQRSTLSYGSSNRSTHQRGAETVETHRCLPSDNHIETERPPSRLPKRLRPSATFDVL